MTANEQAARKKVLLIAPVFFDYYKSIKKELEQMAFEVTYVCDAPSNNNLSKALGRINKNLIKQSTKKYYQKTVEPLIDGKQFDYVLLVCGMTFALTPEMVGEIREKNPNGHFIMYQWDSEKNLPYTVCIHQYFDSVFSFDINDCSSKSFYRFLPLFYTREYEEIGRCEKNSYEYDCSYVGTAHPKKYADINRMSRAFEKLLPRQCILHYMPSRLKYIYHKLLSPEYRKAKYKEFITEKVKKDELLDIIKQSRCILDAPQANQTGLTIRTIESLGANRKLITTNADVKKYDFYNPNNILVFDNQDFKAEDPFFSSDYEPVPRDIYSKYALRNWISTMINSRE